MKPALPDHPPWAQPLVRATSGWRPWPVLILFCLVLWLPGFFTLPPTDRDEARFAQASKQMIEAGDFIQIRNGMVARNQKPIGIYWMQLPFAAAAHSLGIARANPIWPYRIPSLLGGLIAVLATYAIGRRLIGPPAALLGAAFLAASVILAVETHMAKTDAALLGATTIAMGGLARAWWNPAELSRRAAASFWVALGIAVLLKGPIAPMVCGLAALWLTAAGRRRGWPRWLLSLRPILGVPILLAIVLPWLIAIALATHGRFFADSVGNDLAGKLAGSDDAHGAPLGTHLMLLPLLLFGGGGAALAAMPSLWRERAAPEIQFLAAWIVPSWLVFELVATKLPHYTLPLYPAVALLAARWMLAPATRASLRTGLACAVTLVAVTALGAAAAALPFVVQPGWSTSDLLGLPPLAIALTLAATLVRAWPDARRAALLTLGATPLFFILILGVELPCLHAVWIAPRVRSALQASWPHGRPADAAFGALGYAEPSLMFLCGTATQLFNTAAPAARFLAASPANILLVDDRQLDLLRRAGARTTAIAHILGYNYSRGRRVALTLLAATR